MERESLADSAVILLALVHEARNESSRLKNTDENYQLIMELDDLEDDIEKQFYAFRRRVRKLACRIKIITDKPDDDQSCDNCSGSRVETLITEPYCFKHCPQCGRLLKTKA